MLSPLKIILLLLVVVGVFTISKIVRKTIADRSGNDDKLDKKSSKPPKSSTDLLKCPDCGTFVASLEEHTCDT